MSRALSLAGFQVILIGRFWVITEVRNEAVQTQGVTGAIATGFLGKLTTARWAVPLDIPSCFTDRGPGMQLVDVSGIEPVTPCLQRTSVFSNGSLPCFRF